MTITPITILWNKHVPEKFLLKAVTKYRYRCSLKAYICIYMYRNRNWNRYNLSKTTVQAFRALPICPSVLGPKHWKNLRLKMLNDIFDYIKIFVETNMLNTHLIVAWNLAIANKLIAVLKKTKVSQYYFIQCSFEMEV